MLFLVMGFMYLIDEIQFMLISSRHICIRSISPSFWFPREVLVSGIQHLQSMVSNEPSEEGQNNNQGSTLGLPSGGPKRAETFSGFDSSRLKPELKESVNRASSMKSERTSKVLNRLPGVASPMAESPKLKHKRRGSGGGSWSFLSKSSSKDSSEKSGSTGEENGQKQYTTGREGGGGRVE